MRTQHSTAGASLNSYRIFETEEFTRSFSRLTPENQRFLRAKLDRRIYPQLREQPYFGTNIKKLRSYVPETWRYRAGNFRIFYGVAQETRIVNILTVEKRKDAYR